MSTTAYTGHQASRRSVTITMGFRRPEADWYHTIFCHIVDGPGMALGVIKGCLHQEQVTAFAEVQPVQVCTYHP